MKTKILFVLGFLIFSSCLYSQDSPDILVDKFFILFSFVPSRNFSFSGTCDATIYNKDKALISIIRNVLHNEKVLWFKDYVIFEGNENGFSRKIILDLNSGFSKEVGVLGFFGLIGKSTTSAFYKSYKDGAILGTTRLNSKYSVVSLSINQSNQVYTGNDNKIPYFYTDSVSIIYIPKIDSFKLFMKSNLKLSFNSNVTSIPFDKSNFDSTLYLLINTFKIYKINSNFRLLSNIRPSNKKMDGIMEFQVIGNKVLFKTLKDITEQDLSSTGDYITKNNLKFNIKDTELAISKKFGCCVSEFGIFDIKSQKIYYPTIHY